MDTDIKTYLKDCQELLEELDFDMSSTIVTNLILLGIMGKIDEIGKELKILSTRGGILDLDEVVEP